MEPLFLNAYWHRHLIYLFQDKIDEALDDLNYINKCNKKSAGGLSVKTVILIIPFPYLWPFSGLIKIHKSIDLGLRTGFDTPKLNLLLIL